MAASRSPSPGATTPTDSSFIRSAHRILNPISSGIFGFSFRPTPLPTPKPLNSTCFSPSAARNTCLALNATIPVGCGKHGTTSRYNGSTQSPIPRPTELKNGNPLTCAKFSTGVWHHAQFFLQRTFGGRLQYGNVSIDGLTTQWNITAPASNTTWADVLGVNHQLDTDASFTGSVTLQEWSDVEDLSAWPQD